VRLAAAKLAISTDLRPRYDARKAELLIGAEQIAVAERFDDERSRRSAVSFTSSPDRRVCSRKPRQAHAPRSRSCLSYVRPKNGRRAS
jgi:hypothetical protein